MKLLSLVLCSLTMLSLGVVAPHAADQIVGKEVTTVTVNIGIDYGTGSVEWHNGTVVRSGESLLNATMTVATVQTTTYAGLGAFVTGINGRDQDPAANLYWTFWIFNPETQRYELPPVGASGYLLTSDQTIQWYYSSGILGPNTSVSLNARLDTSTDPPTAMISGSIHPTPGGPVNVTLEYSQDQARDFQQITKVTSAPDGTFSYQWKLPGSGMFQIRADAQGVKSDPVSVGATAGIPGFPIESLVIGGILGLSIGLLVHRRRSFSFPD